MENPWYRLWTLELPNLTHSFNNIVLVPQYALWYRLPNQESDDESVEEIDEDDVREDGEQDEVDDENNDESDTSDDEIDPYEY